ncbi:helix-turn-helix domain-containing protein [Sutterella sp.]|uniref:helix-turn-helix domain-containing protein n=1 Tax=Sutterella sp. TaxID=1981025 RepID=UPI0026E05CD9|nr:helix-turn-helix domain-containing protein [Sutterella sp.]MDO5532266.1 helix-turn-helix domain-containing protein [Sutterella sp.]
MRAQSSRFASSSSTSPGFRLCICGDRRRKGSTHQPLKPEIVREIRARSEMGVPTTRIAKALGISVASCYRYLKKKEGA